MVNRAAMKERFNPRFETTNDVLFSLTTFRLIEFKDYSEHVIMAGSWKNFCFHKVRGMGKKCSKSICEFF